MRVLSALPLLPAGLHYHAGLKTSNHIFCAYQDSYRTQKNGAVEDRDGQMHMAASMLHRGF
ncbi:0ba94c2b-ac1f-4662-a89c-54479f7391ec [Thermothielavioides terrestris]|uniref:0ba94c2b-ac1f-4662-a89c-54479f7391ec n=1 Tax=Thermothielavioides terrestris TaxID=2587410 RepID=A0A3S4B6C1_9PEZI|nr:0ba94c2b-ac1f-4662-a89c-54479f7391ec [Thermothielavioides terrestris]